MSRFDTLVSEQSNLTSLFPQMLSILRALFAPRSNFNRNGGSILSRYQHRKGNYWDNVSIESLWGSLKVGRLYGKRFEARSQAMDEVIDWLNYLQPQKIAFDTELHHSNEVRAKLTRSTVEKDRIISAYKIYGLQRQDQLADNSNISHVIN